MRRPALFAGLIACTGVLACSGQSRESAYESAVLAAINSARTCVEAADNVEQVYRAYQPAWPGRPHPVVHCPTDGGAGGDR